MAALRGKVIDKSTGKGIFNAHVVFCDESGNYGSPVMGTVTDIDGNYQLETLGGQFITVSHVAFKTQIKEIDFSNFQSNGSYSQQINFEMDGSGIMLPEVVIRPAKNVFEWAKANKVWIYSGIAISLLSLAIFLPKKK
jgi:hypothetical protein